MLSLYRSVLTVLQTGIQQAFCHGRQEIHRKEDIPGIPARRLNIPGIGRAARQHDPVILLFQFLRRDVPSHVHAGLKDHSFCLHQTDPAIQDLFLQLHVGNAVAQKSPDPVLPFIHGDQMSPPVQLLRRRQTGRTAPDDRHGFAGTHFRRLWQHPSTGKCVLDDGFLIFLCGHRLPVQIAGAGSFTESRADSGSKFRKTVSLRKPLVGLLPVPAVNQIVCLRYQIVKRTPGCHSCQHLTVLAERYAALHAAAALLLLFFQRQWGTEFTEVADSFQRFFHFRIFSLIFQKSCRLSHLSLLRFL